MAHLNLTTSSLKLHLQYFYKFGISNELLIRRCTHNKTDYRNYFTCKKYPVVHHQENKRVMNLLAPSNYLLKFVKTDSEYNLIQSFHDFPHKDIPNVSLTQIKQVLNSKKVEFTDGFTVLIMKCPLCTNVKKHELYINKVSGLVMCIGCKRSGKWSDLQELLLKTKKTNSSDQQIFKRINSETGDKWKELSKSLESVGTLSDERKQFIFDALDVKVLSNDLIDQLHMYVDKSLNNIYIPLKHSGSNDIVGYKVIKILQRSEKENRDELDSENPQPKVEELTEPCQNCRGILLFKSKSVKKDNAAVLVHNFKDFLSLAMLNLNYHIICLPHGLTSLPQEILPVLEKFKKIIFWFGNSNGCWDAARQFSKKLFEDRCYFVRPTNENPAAHIIASKDNGAAAAKHVIENAESIRHPSIINFSLLRQEVFSELQNVDKVQGVRWRRFPGLNNLLKGFRRGELTIFTGPTGSGKTTFLSEYSLDLLTQEVPTLWGSFEVRNQRLARMMLQQYVQLPLELHPDKLNYWADSFERLPLHFMTFHGQQPLKVVLEAVEHASYIYDIAHVIIDNVQFMLGMLDSETNLDRFYRQDALIAAFRNFATSYNCHVTLVIHPRKERDAEQLSINSVFGGAKASQEADNVFIIQQKMLQSLKIKKYLQVAKNRFSGDLGLIPLEFDKETLCFSTRIDKKQPKASHINVDPEGLPTNESDIEELYVLQ